MKSLKITKILLSLVLMLGLTTSSFAKTNGGKMDKNYKNSPQIEQQIHKKDAKNIHFEKRHKHKHNKNDNFARKNHRNAKNIKIVKVCNGCKKHHHHKHHHDKNIYYSYNYYNDDALAKCLGTGVCLAMIAAINS